MASNAPNKPTKPDPLGFMTKLSPWVRVYQPTTAAPSNSKAPGLIVLFSWMGASSSPIAKYVRSYQDMYPTSQVLLVRCSLMHFLPPPAKITPNIAPALPVIRAAAATNTQHSRPNILLHVFSNGGSAMVSKLRAAYGPDFPPHVTVFDSCPGLKNFTRDMRANTSGMSSVVKILAFPFLSILLMLYYLFYLGREDNCKYYYRVHNETTNEIRRAYIYSDGDVIVDSKAIENHAKLAEDKGFAVTLEKFLGTRHVTHVRGDEERYWKIIRSTWEG